MHKSLGQAIRERREEKDFSVRELAKKIDVSAAFLSDVELGRRHPSEDTLAKIARALSVPVDDLKVLDTRPAVEELRKLAASDPAFGFAFRQIVEKQLTAEELLAMVNRKKDSEGGAK